MTTTFDATKHGIYRHFRREDGSIHSPAWNRAVEGKEHVGTCRWCGGYLVGEPTTQTGRITWFLGRCTSCSRELASPNGEVLRRSGRWDEMPAGWFENRHKNKKPGEASGS